MLTFHCLVSFDEFSKADYNLFFFCACVHACVSRAPISRIRSGHEQGMVEICQKKYTGCGWHCAETRKCSNTKHWLREVTVEEWALNGPRGSFVRIATFACRNNWLYRYKWFGATAAMCITVRFSGVFAHRRLAVIDVSGRHICHWRWDRYVCTEKSVVNYQSALCVTSQKGENLDYACSLFAERKLAVNSALKYFFILYYKRTNAQFISQQCLFS